jgi:uncharacterized membrane protein YgdD (TMEM256/DUF423 family)
MRSSRIVSLGAVLCFLGVAIGAFGAHGLKHVIDPELFPTFQTGAHYFLIHALAILIYGVWPRRSHQRCHSWPVLAFGSGLVLFSGSLFALSITGIRALGAITPVGGVFFMLGWLGFAWQSWKHAHPSEGAE